MKKVILFVLLATSLFAGEKWSTTNKVLFSSHLIGSIIDVQQTKIAMQNGGVELNPIYGKQPSELRLYTTKTIMIGLLYICLNNLPANHRNYLLLFVNTIQWSIVYHNHTEMSKVGIRFYF